MKGWTRSQGSATAHQLTPMLKYATDTYVFNTVVPLHHVGSKGADAVVLHLSDNQLGRVDNVIVVVLRLVNGLACSLRHGLVCESVLSEIVRKR